MDNIERNLATNDRSIRLIGATIVFLTFGVFGLWAFLAPLDSSALAPGVVVVKSYKKTVQHLDGGIVAKILVKDGDEVEAGQILMLLDDAQINAQLEIARSQWIALAAQVARLKAERDHLPQVEFPLDWEADTDSRIQEAKQAEMHLFKVRKAAHEGEINVLQQRISQISSKINGLQGQASSKSKLISSYSEEIEDLKALLADGFVDKQRLREIERSHAMNQGDIAQIKAEKASNELLITETRLQIMQLEKDFQGEVAGKLSEAQALLSDAEQRVSAAQDKLERTVIKAPADGMVLGLAVHTENGVIAPGTAILEIVPQQSDLIIEAQVSPMDIDRVAVGLTAEVRFTAFKQSQTPKMTGKVIQVSADRFIDEKTGQAYFQARVELTRESQDKLGSLQLLPGMPAEVLINTGERTLFQYLAQPASNAIARAMTED